MRFSLLLTTSVLGSMVAVWPAIGATMVGWDVGWNDMATVSGGTTTSVLSTSNNLQYVKIEQANIDFTTDNFVEGDATSGTWSEIFGDQGQYFFDGSVRNSWYGDSVDEFDAYDWDGYPTPGEDSGEDFEWLVNNYAGTENTPTETDLKNSHVRGTDSSFTYNEDSGTFTANLTSDGIWYWYTPSTADSLMSGWIKDFDWSQDTSGTLEEYYGRYMTGNFRLVGTFGEDTNNLPQFDTATLQYEVANVPEPITLAVWSILALVGIGLIRRRRLT